jgi:hypothetical protein
VAAIETHFLLGRHLGDTGEKLADRLLDALGDLERRLAALLRKLRQGFFARGPRFESVALGSSNPWLLDPSGQRGRRDTERPPAMRALLIDLGPGDSSAASSQIGASRD